jgi:hypothetical protein
MHYAVHTKSSYSNEHSMYKLQKLKWNKYSVTVNGKACEHSNCHKKCNSVQLKWQQCTNAKWSKCQHEMIKNQNRDKVNQGSASNDQWYNPVKQLSDQHSSSKTEYMQMHQSIMNIHKWPSYKYGSETTQEINNATLDWATDRFRLKFELAFIYFWKYRTGLKPKLSLFTIFFFSKAKRRRRI